MRARSRSCPRRLVAGLVAAGTIEIAAGARDAVEDALRAVHHDGAGDALRVEGHEGASCRADRVVGGVAAVALGVLLYKFNVSLRCMQQKC